MDTNELTLTLREAAEDVEPRPNFAADVLRGGRRRRSRNRFTIGAAIAGTAAVAVVAATVLPNQQAAPPTADRPKQNIVLTFSGGDLIDDENVTRNAVLGWEGIANGAGEAAGVSPDDLIGEPHVYWAGTTSLGATAIVMQEVTRPDGQTGIATGLVVDNPDDDRPDELELVAVQLGNANFLLPDHRTVLAAMPTPLPEGLSLFVSGELVVSDDDGRSTRGWTELTGADGVVTGELPEGTNPRNIRLVTSSAEGDPNDGPHKMGAHQPLAVAGGVGDTPNRGFPWPAELRHVPETRDLPRPARDVFQDGLLDSGLLDPSSYSAGEPQWMVAADLSDGRTLILSQHQELDNPAWMFSVLMRQDGSVETVNRVTEIDPASTVPVIAPAPDGQGTVVAAWGEPISYRTSTTGDWTDVGSGAALVPADAVEIMVSDTAYDLG